jgi:2-polyprenyl-6-methoxyphenol hydroxylase-like FAD-dependent oxidoreductase
MSDEASIGAETVQTRCCIAGGGPAGMMLGYLLARAGVEVVVLEKHKDFLRDFRGDTIHPSTLEVMYELGILDELLKRPHQEARTISGVICEVEVPVADFTHLPTQCGYIAFMPQWDFLDFIAGQARRYSTFHLRMEADVQELLHEEGRVAGVRAATPGGTLEVRAELTVGADGRHSTVRLRSGLVVDDIGAPIDVLWMRVSRRETDPQQPLGRFDRGKILVMLYRGDYWQCGYVIPKGGIEAIRQKGLEAFHKDIVEIAPFLHDRVSELADWDSVRLLTVTVDRLREWHRPGLLCIGDAAHAMSPIGGVGINLAIQDAVATANILADRLREGSVTTEVLRKVKARRWLPTRLTQRLQVIIQNQVIGRVIASHETISLAWPLKLLRQFPVLRRIPARLIGIGFRPEHVRTPEVAGANVGR